jgi:hypothetical protein
MMSRSPPLTSPDTLHRSVHSLALGDRFRLELSFQFSLPHPLDLYPLAGCLGNLLRKFHEITCHRTLLLLVLILVI